MNNERNHYIDNKSKRRDRDHYVLGIPFKFSCSCCILALSVTPNLSANACIYFLAVSIRDTCNLFHNVYITNNIKIKEFKKNTVVTNLKRILGTL